MTEQVRGIQTSVLQWARESQGFSIDEVAVRMKRDPAQIAAWESGESSPTYAQLETLAYKIYKRPLAIFFFPQPPQEPAPETEFRTLPDYDLEDLTSDTRYQIRFAHSLQLSLKELNSNLNPASRQIFRHLTLSINRDIASQASEVRGYLGIDLEAQIRWRRSDIALTAWRNAIGEAGIFVFKHAFKEKQISGFCLIDDQFPIIYINNSTSKTRQIFSIFHELGHVLLHVNGISKFNTSYIVHLRNHERRIEQFSNAFAAELLMPSEDFDREIRQDNSLNERSVERLAQR